MANSNNRHSFLWEKTMNSGAVKLKRFKTTSAAKIGVGDPLVISSGYVKLAGATSTALFGFAAESCTSTAGVRKSVAIIPALGGYLFSAQHSNTLNVTAGYVGKRCGIGSSTSSGKIGLNLAATTSVLQVMGLKPGSAWGTYAELMVAVVRSSYDGSIR
jgi:hypothetical protein